MSLPTCETYFTCDNADLSLEAVFRMMIVDDGSGCPQWRGISGGSGGGQSDTNLTQYRNTSLSTTGQTVVASARKLRGWNFVNPNASAVYVKLYNQTGDPSSSDTPVKTLLVPSNGTVVQDNTGFQQHNFTTGIGIRCSTGLADSDNAAPSIGVYVELYYTS